MGSWNGTCGVTHLPISAGDDVVLIFLTHAESKGFDSGMLYSNQSWSPCFFPIYGKYNDYGAVEDIDEDHWHSEFVLSTIKNSLIEKEVGENEYHEQAVKKDEITTFEDLFKLIHTSRIHLYLTTDIKQFGFVDNRLGYMMVHEEIYEHLTQNSDKLIEDSKVNYINILRDMINKLNTDISLL